ncbi:MAG: DUF4336 domain-containing protein [Xenococcaceae cyanobacterium MO_188.B19]|nr:DUF4336 domain-containing protein [Xenococcaceae cyanobacterium MO_188.B19]
MLKQVGHCIWVAEEPLKFLGLPVGTRMTVILRSDNSLVLISPIKIDANLKQQLDSLGTVKYIIAPNLFHHLFLENCQQIYPQAELIAPPGIETKQPNIAISQTFGRDKIDFNGELEYIPFKGFQACIPPKIVTVNEIVFFHPDSKTLILTDSAFNFDRNFPLITQLAARIIGSYQSLQPSLLEKIAIRDKEAISASISHILAWDFQQIIVAHGNIVEKNAKEKLAAGYEWFLS